MMQINDSRLFKANRRTIRAEVSLVVVIVISFSWSAYALYKLVLNNSDGSLFGLGGASPAPAQSGPVSEATKSTGEQRHVKPSENSRVHGVDVNTRLNLTEQLTQYKRQILKELLERQRNLLGQTTSKLGPAASEFKRIQGASDTSTGSGAAPYEPQAATSFTRKASSPQGPDIGELSGWRGGYVTLPSLDYSFDSSRARRGRQVERASAASGRSPLSVLQGHRRPKLGALEEAPSLMQLTPKLKTIHRSGSNGDQGPHKVVEISRETDLEPNDGHETSDDRMTDEQESTTASPVEPTDDDLDKLNEPTTTTEMPPTYLSLESTTGSSTTTTTTTQEPPEAASRQEQDDADETPEGSTSEDNNHGGSEEDNSEELSQSRPGSEPTADQADEETGNDEDDTQSMERIKSTVHAIDKEVDKMTQPSLSLASRQDRPSHFKNNQVQFDDDPSSASRKLGQKDERVRRQVSARPDVPDKSAPLDLQVADDRAKQPPVISSQGNFQPSVSRASTAASPAARSVAYVIRDGQQRTRTRSAGIRTKRSAERELIPRTNTNPLRGGSKTMVQNDGFLGRRSDDDDDDEDHDEDSDEPQNGQDHSDAQQDYLSNHGATDQLSPQINHHYIKTNDPTLEDLLAHKKLLDSLQQEKLPPPMADQDKPLDSQAASNSAPSSKQLAKGRHQNAEDGLSADTIHTVDHGLLLYPAGDENLEHKSLGKKSKNMAHKKAKKKVVVAMKKGGHKEKKHKKEEKKYLKEKKFKGAKKGKKMSKGKGGKGGKKGKKFYKDKGFKKKGFKNIYVKNEFGQKKSYFDEFRDKDFKKKWKNFDDKYKYANMKKWQAKDVKGAKKMKDHGEKFKKYNKGRWKKKYHKHQASESAKKKKKYDEF